MRAVSPVYAVPGCINRRTTAALRVAKSQEPDIGHDRELNFLLVFDSGERRSERRGSRDVVK